jgi:membrane protease subunit HflK
MAAGSLSRFATEHEMAWNEPGGGKKDPWNGSGGGSGGGDQGPDVEAFLNRLKANLNRVFGGGPGGTGGRGRGAGGSGGPPIALIAGGLLAVWLLFDSMILIDERDRGVVLRFGKYDRLMTPGLNFKWPRPFEHVDKVPTTGVRNVSDQVRMLTKDENIVLVDFNVQYQVSDPKQFLFGTRDPDATLQQAAESAVREVMGNSAMDTILSGQRAELAAQARERLQSALDQYQTGLAVSEFNLQNARPPQEVKDAFDDAITAREDKQRIENEAEAYASKQVPEARGDAARIKSESEGYKAATIARAEGDASRFALLVEQYRKAPAITRKRLYLDTMQGVLADNRKVVVSDRNGNNILYLPMDQGRAATAPPRAADAAVQRVAPLTTTTAPREAYKDPRDARRSDRDGGGQ